MASNKRQTKRQEDTPLPPNKDFKRGYWSFFGEQAPPGAEEEHRREIEKKRKEEAIYRREGYEWLFDN